MNYGYRAPDAAAGQPRLELEPADEDNRSCIQLYDLVARGAPVAGRDLLEVGCGRGGGADYVARKLDPRRVVAVESVPPGRRALPPPLRAPSPLVRGRRRRTVAVRHTPPSTSCSTSSRRTVTAASRPSWARSVACCAPAGISSTRTFVPASETDGWRASLVGRRLRDPRRARSPPGRRRGAGRRRRREAQSHRPPHRPSAGRNLRPVRRAPRQRAQRRAPQR